MDLERARREAETLVRDGTHEKLADAQLAIARRLGERSWRALVARTEGEAILAAALAGRDSEVEWRARERPRAAAYAQAAGQPELLAAAAEGRAKAVRSLLLMGVDPNVRDASGHTALDLARNDAVRRILTP